MRELFKGWRRKTGLLAAIVLFWGVGFELTNVFRLQNYGSFINRKYAKEIAVLEAAALAEIDEGALSSASEQLQNRLGNSFDAEVFYTVDGSWDGHHGARFFKLMPEHVTIYTHGGARIDSRHTLHFAGTSSGTPLLRYNAKLLDAPLFKYVSIVFLRKTIDKEMEEMDRH